MRRSASVFLLAGLLLGVLERPGFADNMTIQQFDDLTDIVTFQIIINGVPQFPTPLNQGGESYTTTLPLSAPTISAVTLSANIFEPVPGMPGVLGPLSDTFLVTAAAGATTITETFVSDTEGVALTPLTVVGVQTIIETGQFQSIGMLTLSNGDTVNFQFRSDIDAAAVPEPASFGLVAIGLIGIAGFVRSGRRRNAA